jgi:predicted S18 family serine protease
MRKRILVLAIVMVFAAAAVFASSAAAQDVKRMTIDARRDGDWKLSKVKIKGAVREDLENVSSWMNKYSKEKTLVFYCA